jgi:thioredoxin-related protein
MKNALLCILTMCLSFVFSLSAQTVQTTLTSQEKHPKFDPQRDADKDILDAIRQAATDHKRILLDVGGEWCIWCHRLDSLFVQNTDLTDYLDEHYVVVKVNVSKENMNKEALSKYPKVAGYPHLFVLDHNGKLLHSQDTGELEYPESYPVKGHDKAKVFAFLKKWAR